MIFMNFRRIYEIKNNQSFFQKYVPFMLSSWFLPSDRILLHPTISIENSKNSEKLRESPSIFKILENKKKGNTFK